LTADSIVLVRYLSVAVEAAGQAYRTIGYRFRQAVLGVAGDGEAPGAGQKTIIVISKRGCVARIGKPGQVEIVAVGVPERLAEGAGQGFGCYQLAVGLGDVCAERACPMQSLHDVPYFTLRDFQVKRRLILLSFPAHHP